jgi:hypothetical protein
MEVKAWVETTRVLLPTQESCNRNRSLRILMVTQLQSKYKSKLLSRVSNSFLHQTSFCL